MRTIIFIFLLIFSAAANSNATIRVNDKIIALGDSTGRVREVAGAPDNIVPIHNKYGAQIGERYEYYKKGKTITFVISEGKVVSIAES